MTDTFYIACALACAALAWWDVERRKSASASAVQAFRAEVAALTDGMTKLGKAVGSIEKDHRELTAIVTNSARIPSRFHRG